MAFYQKHRPASFDEVVGERNRATVKSILSLLGKADPPHAWLLRGERGCGKTTIARLIAKALGCVGEDYREVDSADIRGIDSVRDIRRVMHFKPLSGPRRCWLLDECHKLTNDAQTALLKGLEDPPPHCYFVLATTDPEKLLPTIRSRCVVYEVHRLVDDEMLRLLRRVASAEGVQLTRTVYEAIVESARGHPRDAIQMLEQAAGDPESARALVEGRGLSESRSVDLYNAMSRGQGWKAVAAVLSDLRRADEDPESLRRLVLACAANELLRGESDAAAVVADEFARPFYDSGFPGLVLAAYSVVRSRH